MAYSESLAERIRTILNRRKDIKEKKMFGGAVFMLNGNMLVGVWNTSLLVRLGPEQGKRALNQEYVSPFVINGRSSKNWVLVQAEGVDEERQLKAWIQRAEEFVETLPAK